MLSRDRKAGHDERMDEAKYKAMLFTTQLDDL